MRIEIVSEGRVFEGTKEQIVAQMQSLSFGPAGETLDGYVARTVRTAQTLGIALRAEGPTPAARAEALIDSMIEQELARRC